MKITKSRLKKLITEVMGTSAGDFRQQSKERAKETQKGLTNDERDLLLRVGKKLQDFAGDKNLLAAGQVTTLIKKLEAELDKVAGTRETEEA